MYEIGVEDNKRLGSKHYDVFTVMKRPVQMKLALKFQLPVSRYHGTGHFGKKEYKF